jgi:L-glyceraldehyde 3-phosphate reductase
LRTKRPETARHCIRALPQLLNQKAVTCALIGASRVEQLLANLKTLENPDFSTDELNQIDSILNDG